MEKNHLRAVSAEQFQTREDIADVIPDSFDHDIVASLSGLPEDAEKSGDWAGVLQLIGNASGVLWQRDTEVESLKTQIELQKTAAVDEMEALQAQLRQAREETQRAYNDAAQANKRAHRAEAWLAQVKEALASGFAPHLGRAQT